MSGINIHIWDNNTNLDNVDATTYIIDFRGIIINNLGICGSGFSICSGLYTVQFGITNWGLIYRFCETNQKHWSAWRII